METIKLIINKNNITIIDLNTDSISVLTLREAVEKYYKNKRIIIKDVEINKNKLTVLEENYINLLKNSHTSTSYIEKDTFEAQILIPYRARGDNDFRQAQLHKFLKHMIKYLNTVHPHISYKLIIVEQNNHHMFNRGLLLNIGYLEREKEKPDKIKYYVHHNCDLFPTMTQTPSLDYSFTPINEVRDIFGYSFGIGGIAIFNRLTFKLIKGFPNNYFNWGAEDTNLFKRCEKNSIQIRRPLYNVGIEEEPHDRDSSFNSINKRKGENDNPNLNGLDTCEYTSCINIESEFNYPNVIHYLVDFNYTI